MPLSWEHCWIWLTNARYTFCPSCGDYVCFKVRNLATQHWRTLETICTQHSFVNWVDGVNATPLDVTILRVYRNTCELHMASVSWGNSQWVLDHMFSVYLNGRPSKHLCARPFALEISKNIYWLSDKQPTFDFATGKSLIEYFWNLSV